MSNDSCILSGQGADSILIDQEHAETILSWESDWIDIGGEG